jgi:hypothetical protein
VSREGDQEVGCERSWHTDEMDPMCMRVCEGDLRDDVVVGGGRRNGMFGDDTQL